MVGGSNRSYTLHVPGAYKGTTPVPLILDFHGLGGNGKGESTSSPYPATTSSNSMQIGSVMSVPEVGIQDLLVRPDLRRRPDRHHAALDHHHQAMA